MRTFPDVAGERAVVSRDGGWSPVWGRDGRELFYLTRQGLMRVPLLGDGGLDVGPEQILFPLEPYRVDTPVTPRVFDIAPDGERFLFQKLPPAAAGSDNRRIDVVLHWFEELKARVPVSP